MIFTTDRVQFRDGKLIVFEFYNMDKEKESIKYIKEKMNYLRDGDVFDACYAVEHNSLYDRFRIVEYDNLTKEKQEIEIDSSQYFRWFCDMNGNSSHSKPLGSAKIEVGDEYVQKILNIINQDYLFDFTNDDNGLQLTIDALSGNVTTGFDFDLFETKSRSIIEFLKRENKYINNKTAHPARYQWNHQKFSSLWNAKKRVLGNLFLVNYSNEGTEKDQQITIIEVINYCEKEGRITSDIGYLLTGFKELIAWITLLKDSHETAKEYLENRPKQVRSEAWWREVYSDFDRNKHKIGEDYV